jgi:hypothetical protein
MKPSFISLRKTSVPTWHGCLCILLIGLMLYNPFAGLWGPVDRLSYDKLASNRATIGASELQHFSPVSNPTIQLEWDVDVHRAGLIVPVQEEYFVADRQESLLPSADRFNPLRNRPPPSL